MAMEERTKLQRSLRIRLRLAAQDWRRYRERGVASLCEYSEGQFHALLAFADWNDLIVVKHKYHVESVRELIRKMKEAQAKMARRKVVS